MSGRVGYVDEAFDDEIYVLGCVIHSGERGHDHRYQLRELLTGRQTMLHFTKENRKRRLRLAEAFADTGLSAEVVVHRGTGRAERRRGLALVHLAWLLADAVDDLVFAARQGKLNGHDNAVLTTARHRPPHWRFSPSPSCEELWAADIVVGSVFADIARGVPDFRAVLGPRVTVHEE